MKGGAFWLALVAVCGLVWPAEASVAAVVSISVNPVQAVHEKRFLSVGWEVAQLVNEAPFLNSSVFAKAASYLQPGFLRVGGISADFMEYEDLDSGLDGWWPSRDYQFLGSKVREMLTFTNQTGLSLLLDLNELFGRNCMTGPRNITCIGDWNTSNTQMLLDWMSENPDWLATGDLVGLELGNEITRSHHLEMPQQIADYGQFHGMVSKAWAGSPSGSQPHISGPSTDICDSTSEAFMKGTQPYLDAFNYHSYPARNCSNATEYYSMMLSPQWLRQRVWLNDYHANASVCASQWRSTGLAAKGVHLQMTETNSCFDTAGPPMTSIANTFWYVSSLGQLAQAGLRMHSRWNMVSKHFGFLSLPQGPGQPWQTAVDFWLAIAYKRAIGSGAVFNATASVSGMGDDSPVLAYAHCSGGLGPLGSASTDEQPYPAGSITLMMINVGKTSSATVSVTQSGHRPVPSSPRLEWIFTGLPLPGEPAYATNRTSLNAAATPLQLNMDGSIPSMSPKRVDAGGPEIELPPLSAAIVVLEAAGSQACAAG